MRLRKVLLRRFMQFVDESLECDRHVTVLVGRNDSGKTSLLRWFFDQHVTGAFHSKAVSLVQGYENDPVSFELTWETEPGDSASFPLRDAFGRNDVAHFSLGFTHTLPGKRDFTAWVDGTPVDPYESAPNEHGIWPLREVFTGPRLFPRSYYLALDEGKLLPMQFQARFYEISPGGVEAMFHRDSSATEVMLLRLAGLPAQTRALPAQEEPWPGILLQKSTMTLREIEDRLAAVSARLTERLAEWWPDPKGLQYRLRLAGSRDSKEYNHRANSYTLAWDTSDKDGIPFYGKGLHWFVSLLVDWLWLEETSEHFLVLIDEPAYSLHPSAQRVVAKILSLLSKRHQLVYATHSPFIIDWAFPQRVRLLERDPITKRTRIRNRPYHSDQRFQTIWDPLRESIGVSLGDLAVIGEHNLLVEGATDQILLANAAASLRLRGHGLLDPDKIGIIPFGDILTLRRLIDRIKSLEGKVIVLCDSDDEGKEIVRICRHASVPVIQVGEFVVASDSSVHTSIEDVFGVANYERAVGQYYETFDWFKGFDLSSVQREERTLGAMAKVTFESLYGRGFDKIGISVGIAEAMQGGEHGLADSLLPMLTALTTALRRDPGPGQ